MGSGGRIDHQTHSVGVGSAAESSPIPQDERLLLHQPDSTAVHTLVMDPDTGDLLVFYRRYDEDSDEPSRGYPLANVTAEQWQRLTDGGASVGRLVQQLANDPAHRPAPAPVSDEAQRLIEALRTTPPPADTAMPVQRRGTDAAEAELGAEHADSAAAREAAEEHEPDGQSYLGSPEAFQRAYREAQQRQQRGEPVVSYMREDATGGLGARDGGRAFGVELEFDLNLPAGQRHQAQQAIVRELHEAGITSSPTIHGYHSGRGLDGRGYTDVPNGWRMELDGSVNGGELVSPIMYDEPQTWDNLERACEIIRRHGGVATVHAGSHVTVSTADYGPSVEHHNRLLNTFSSYEDTLYRLATDPARGRHRISSGSGYCVPNTVPAEGYQNIESVRHRQGGHNFGLNLQHSNGRANDRAEFRLWDATLDPAAIQTQIKLSLGMAAAAARGTTGGGTRREPLGSHRASNPTGARATGASWLATTESFRSLVDSVFYRAADKAQATSLFAATRRWQQRGR
jgi:hypothetical protein